MDFIITRDDCASISHYGVKGQKWGDRRYQNEDGTLTEEGKVHYDIGQGNRYQNSDGSLTKAGMKEQKNIEKWYNSTRGKAERNQFSRKGLSDYDAYKSHRMTKAGTIGWAIGGPVGSLVGSFVTHKRREEGKRFIEDMLQFEREKPAFIKELSDYGINAR